MNLLKIILLLLPFALVACAHLRVESDPKGADVLINGRNFGKTPTKAIRINRTYLIEISKDGYKTYLGTISSRDDNPYKVILEEKKR